MSRSTSGASTQTSLSSFIRWRWRNWFAHTQEMIAAAYLHDVVEDTPVSIHEIREEIGPEVSELVDWLTDVSKPEDGNRRVRKELDRQHLAKAPP